METGNNRRHSHKEASSIEWTKMIKSRLHPKSQNYANYRLTNFIKIFFDFSYYTCTSPFRFIKSKEDNEFVLKTWMPQKCVCGFLHVACTVQMIAAVWSSVPTDSTKFTQNPVPYFDIASTFSSLMYKTITMKRFWMHQNDYLEVLNSILREKCLPISKRKIQGIWQVSIIYSVPTIQAIVCFVVGMPFVSSIWTWTPTWWLRRLVAHSRNTLLFGERVQDGVAPMFSEITFVDGILSVITGLGMLSRHFLSFYCDLSILACSLTLWVTANSFSCEITEEIVRPVTRTFVEKEPEVCLDSQSFATTISAKTNMKDESKWERIYSQFQAIRNVSSAINHAMGSQITWLMAENIMYYSINLNVVLLTRDVYYRIYLIMFYGITSTLFILSADICNQLETIKSWLMKNDNIQSVPFHDANLVLHELLAKEIGIRGSNVFTLTYSLVATCLSLVVTFFIICIQYSGV